MSAATTANGALVSKQDYGPWGTVRSGGIAQTTRNFTGQRRDGTGLLYYNARSYDPALARFISADSVVPGAADGSLDGVALKPLTVALGEPDLTTGVNTENRQPFWFQMSDQQRQQANAPWGPQNAQALNRYSYGLNNPVKYNDPTGHTPPCTTPGCGAEVINNSNDPVRVQGNIWIPGCDPNQSGGTLKCYQNVEVVLNPGESTADYGLTDVDRIRAMDGNTLAGYDSSWIREISNGTRVTLVSDGPGNTTGYLQCVGAYWYYCSFGEMGGAFVVDGGGKSGDPWDKSPGWYKAKEKWWKKNVVYLPSKPRRGRR